MVDFIDFTLINFAVFNVADSFVTVGACILIVCFIREQVLEMRTAKAQETAQSVAQGTGQTGRTAEESPQEPELPENAQQEQEPDHDNGQK